MKKRLRAFGVLQTSFVIGALYALLGLVFALIAIPVVVIASILGASGPGFAELGIIVFLCILAPVLYGIMGFVGGLVVVVIYNLIAGLTGGIELIFEDAPGVNPGTDTGSMAGS